MKCLDLCNNLQHLRIQNYTVDTVPSHTCCSASNPHADRTPTKQVLKFYTVVLMDSQLFSNTTSCRMIVTDIQELAAPIFCV